MCDIFTLPRILHTLSSFDCHGSSDRVINCVSAYLNTSSYYAYRFSIVMVGFRDV